MVCYLSVAVKGANCVFDGSFHRATSVDFWWSVFKPPASRGRHSASVFWIQTAHHRFRCEFLLWLVHVPAALCFFSNFSKLVGQFIFSFRPSHGRPEPHRLKWQAVWCCFLVHLSSRNRFKMSPLGTSSNVTCLPVNTINIWNNWLRGEK